ncbi:MAG: SDR family oxidoreductase [bacterium]|nr:SDR family oxidoreductase [bacterium]
MNILVIIAILVVIFLVFFAINVLQAGIGGWDGRSMENILGVSPEDAVPEDLERLSKSELMQLFYAAPAPEFLSIKGEIKGKMLPVGILFFMVRILERRIFGRGTWLGKAFIQNEKDRGWGYNLFVSPGSSGSPGIDRMRKFDSYVAKSKIDSKDSFYVDYFNYNRALIHGFCDEFRKINDRLYIGQAYISYFGGSINPSPFYLYDEPEEIKGVDSMKLLEGKWALVTGASSGIGVDFSNVLAEYGCNIILTARREQLLQQEADKIAAKFGVKTEIEALDLSLPTAPMELMQRVKQKGITVDILINNAGSGVFGTFTETSWERIESMIKLNVNTLTHLTKIFADDMANRNYGYILQVAANSGHTPVPNYASYAASKAYVLSFGQALAQELRKSNVKVSVLSPGVVSTSFLDLAGQNATFFQRLFMMKTRIVAESGINAMLKGKQMVVPGIRGRTMLLLNHFVSRRFLSRFTYWFMRH